MNLTPASDWQLELLVRRQTGPLDSIFTSFKADYHTLDQYVDRPPLILPEPELHSSPASMERKRC